MKIFSIKFENRLMALAALIAFLISGFLLTTAAQEIKISEEQKALVIESAKKELGCDGEKACRVFCDQPDNFSQCFAFARKYKIIDEINGDDEEQIKRLARAVKNGEGPGQCRSQKECDNYCDNIDHIDECVSFAEEHRIMTGEELDEAKKIRGALAKGVKTPGNCKNKKECEKYCFEGGDDENDFKKERVDECVDFGVAAGFVGEKDAAIIKKTGGVGPGGCRGRKCESYCEDSDHQAECLAFAEKYELISKEEARFAKKVMRMTGCRNRQECEQKFKDDPELGEKIFTEIKNENPDFDFNKVIPSQERIKIKNEIQQRINQEFKNFPPPVVACARPAVEQLINNPKFSPFNAESEIKPIVEKCFQEHFQNQAEKFTEESAENTQDQTDEFYENNSPDFPNKEIINENQQEIRDVIKENLFHKTKDDFEKLIRPLNNEAPHFENDKNPSFPPEQMEGVQQEFDKRFQQEFDKRFEQQFQQELQRNLPKNQEIAPPIMPNEQQNRPSYNLLDPFMGLIIKLIN